MVVVYTSIGVCSAVGLFILVPSASGQVYRVVFSGDDATISAFQAVAPRNGEMDVCASFERCVALCSSRHVGSAKNLFTTSYGRSGVRGDASFAGGNGNVVN